MTDSPLERLAAYRLANDLTFEQLAEQMGAADFAVPARALHLALTSRLKTKPRDRTLYKISEFLKVLDERTRRNASRRAAKTSTSRHARTAAHG